MTRHRVQVVVLAEDIKQALFARAALSKLGFAARDIRTATAPRGRGSAEYWVRNNYANSVRKHRAGAKGQRDALLVVTDGDKHGYKKRRQQLDAQLANGLKPRGAHERIALWLPTWSIETWMLELAGYQDIAEDKRLKHDKRVRKLSPESSGEQYAHCYNEWKQSGTPPKLPSLAASCPETKRIA